jgi:hypothetical protein
LIQTPFICVTTFSQEQRIHNDCEVISSTNSVDVDLKLANWFRLEGVIAFLDRAGHHLFDSLLLSE